MSNEVIFSCSVCLLIIACTVVPVEIKKIRSTEIRARSRTRKISIVFKTCSLVLGATYSYFLLEIPRASEDTRRETSIKDASGLRGRCHGNN